MLLLLLLRCCSIIRSIKPPTFLSVDYCWWKKNWFLEPKVSLLVFRVQKRQCSWLTTTWITLPQGQTWAATDCYYLCLLPCLFFSQLAPNIIYTKGKEKRVTFFYFLCVEDQSATFTIILHVEKRKRRKEVEWWSGISTRAFQNQWRGSEWGCSYLQLLIQPLQIQFRSVCKR